ncbi:MAG: type III-B CRISPR module RAMP protein Cmr6 [Thermocladium sp.]
MALEILNNITPSPIINIPSYLRLKLVSLVMNSSTYRQAMGEGKHEDYDMRNYINQNNREIMEKLSESYRCSNGIIKDILGNVDHWIEGNIKALEALGYAVAFKGVMMLLTRLSIGLSNPYMEPLEPAIAWDPYWNLPYIPASSLKGAMRFIAESKGNPCKMAFGNLNESSSIIVLDAYPTYCLRGSLISLDIINPHYRETEGRISEVQSKPSPLPFITVSRGVGFKIAILVARNRLKERTMACNDHDTNNYIYIRTTQSNCEKACTEDELRNIIAAALENGIGAKTSLGYGIFDTK